MNKAVLLLLVEEERPMRDPAHQMIAPPSLELPLLSHFARSISHHDLSRNDIFTATSSPGSDPLHRQRISLNFLIGFGPPTALYIGECGFYLFHI